MSMDTFQSDLHRVSVPPKGLVEAITQSLINAILGGVLKEGDQLIEADLQRQYGVSKSPLREAIRSLENSGLVRIVPRKGSFVRSFTVQDIEENYEVRSLLEGLAIRRAYRNMDTGKLGELQAAVEDMEAAVASNNPLEYWKHHHRFHEIYLEASGNKTLISVLKTLRRQNIWYQREVRDHLEIDFRPYKEILALLRNKNASEDEMDKIMQRDIIGRGLDNFRMYTKKPPSS